jgi:hypothetical protein
MGQGETIKTRLLESLYGEVSLGAFGLTPGASATFAQGFVGGATKVLTVNPDLEDSLDFDLVLPRSLEIDISTVTLTPSVRWTATSSPAANTIIQWKLDYTYAIPALTGAAGTAFVDVRTMTTSVQTLTGAEYRKHICTPFTHFDFPSRDMKPSMLMVGNVRISSSVSTCGNLIGILSVGCSYLEGPSGASSITP